MVRNKLELRAYLLQKKKSYYKKLAIYALIAIPAYIIIASYYPDVFNFEQFGQEGSDYYFNSIDEKFSVIADGKILKSGTSEEFNNTSDNFC